MLSLALGYVLGFVSSPLLLSRLLVFCLFLFILDFLSLPNYRLFIGYSWIFHFLCSWDIILEYMPSPYYLLKPSPSTQPLDKGYLSPGQSSWSTHLQSTPRRLGPHVSTCGRKEGKSRYPVLRRSCKNGCDAMLKKLRINWNANLLFHNGGCPSSGWFCVHYPVHSFLLIKILEKLDLYSKVAGWAESQVKAGLWPSLGGNNQSL